MKRLIIIVAVLLIGGCVPSKRVYRVEFADGSYDYYELNYKPKTTDKSIQYEDETILGVSKIEQIK